MKIAIITTVNHNVGDDFVREGIKYLLRERFKDETLSFENIHKHSPITVRYGFERFRKYPLSKKVDDILPLCITGDRIREADLIVQSGAPVYWCHESVGSHCCNNEWYQPLIKRRALQKSAPVVWNLAAGSCQRYDSDGSEIISCQRDSEYIRELYSHCAVTTLRDPLAQQMLRYLGLEAPVIPCSSIFAINELGVKSEQGEYIVVNYMYGGSHFTFGQSIDAEKWRNEFTRFYNEISKREKVVFVCHNEKELREAREIDPKANVFISNDYVEYIKFYARARFGIMNRVHGAFLMASLGKPSFVVGNDSRARMVSQIGLASMFVNYVDYSILMYNFEKLSSDATHFSSEFDLIKDTAFKDYQKALGGPI